MPRTARTLGDGCIYHVTNYGRGGQEVFRSNHDYLGFLDLLMVSRERYAVQLYAFCLLPDHFHLLVKPDEDSDLSYCMQWLQTSYARRFKDYYQVEGPIWQGRFGSCPVQPSPHLLTIIHFIENHPLRCGLADQAIDYVWSSHRENYLGNVRQKLDDPPVALAPDWCHRVNQQLQAPILEQVVLCTRRQLPYGSFEWQQKMCRQLGIKASLRPRGRPRKNAVTALLACTLLLGAFGQSNTRAADLDTLRVLKLSAPEQAAVISTKGTVPGSAADHGLKLVRVGDHLTPDTRITAIDDHRLVVETKGKQGTETRVITLRHGSNEGWVMKKE